MSIRLTININHTAEPALNYQPQSTISYDQTGQGVVSKTVAIADSGTEIDFGDVTPGLVMAYNLDTDNAVTFGPIHSGEIVPVGVLEANSKWPCSFFVASGATIGMIASPSGCNVQVMAYNS